MSVNPFKMLNIYSEKEIDQYQGAVSINWDMKSNYNVADTVSTNFIQYFKNEQSLITSMPLSSHKEMHIKDVFYSFLFSILQEI